ncbi:hypothetical protein FLK61_39065 [Paenalkalicoccus suaedae]|uniref:Uncharacterized protein n=1 Tax=Paenalkalicoccus suaedae TaxID=2592382 RepID=A0A859FID9_9BACI|nr:hypothetical protein [Paenalkalicoccus suaedae]QKS72618.1 hypothetical protein FLK61_39065 [Paenalkalicoccus suaedae]
MHTSRMQANVYEMDHGTISIIGFVLSQEQGITVALTDNKKQTHITATPDEFGYFEMLDLKADELDPTMFLQTNDLDREPLVIRADQLVVASR